MAEPIMGATNPAEAVATAFTRARRAATPLSDYPGELPTTLASAYAVQDAAIALWPDEIAGWKVAGVAPQFRERYDAPRLIGPAFAPRILKALNGGDAGAFPVFADGFAAVEAEFIFRMAADVDPADAADHAKLAGAVAAMHAGSEIASSPFARINELGPASVISDFGNNAGLILGPELPGWRDAPLERFTSRTRVNGEIVGEGDAAKVAGGPLAALAFLVEALGRRGLKLRAGDLVSTGMTTGIHPVRPGDKVLFEFSNGVSFHAVAEAAQPLA